MVNLIYFFTIIFFSIIIYNTFFMSRGGVGRKMVVFILFPLLVAGAFYITNDYSMDMSGIESLFLYEQTQAGKYPVVGIQNITQDASREHMFDCEKRGSFAYIEHKSKSVNCYDLYQDGDAWVTWCEC